MDYKKKIYTKQVTMAFFPLLPAGKYIIWRTVFCDFWVVSWLPNFDTKHGEMGLSFLSPFGRVLENNTN